MTTLDSRGFLTGFAAFVFFTGFAADAWRNSITWWGYGVVVIASLVLAIVVLVRHRLVLRASDVPVPLVAFLALCAASIVWSRYPLESAAGLLLQLLTTTIGLAVALTVDRAAILRALGRALTAILALSLVFELVVAFVVRAPVLPVWVVGADRVDPPLLLFWSRNVLLDGEPVQGIVGSSSLLAMVAFLAIIVLGVQLAAGMIRRSRAIAWLALAGATVAITRSATVLLGLVAVAVVLAMILIVRRTPSGRPRAIVYGSLAVAGVGLVAIALVAREGILSTLGKSSDLTGRAGIWEAVIGLAEQRPALGWGWISFWAPWREPFADLVTRNGVVQLHAHNAWLDVWLQLGIVGLVVFGALVLSTTLRAWLLATDRVVTSASERGRFSSVSLAAPLLMTALLVQSLAESRLLIEGGWLLLVVLAASTKASHPSRARSLPSVVDAEVRS
ncbi:O-antigen ligase family protein [Marisediminicola sp. LYQ134]|uniref:O-antigen ligase family protein n=1 Tax=Marisediminicola sp. LYQ134 TaxID=3391061 RepID=UPI003982F4BC